MTLASSESGRLQEAGQLLLELADFIYGHTSLKPTSKTLFVLSRCLLAASGRRAETVAEVVQSYERQAAALRVAPADGVLAIILPDGIIRASWFKETILCYERTRASCLNLLAIVSLPTVTFSLGGTVAKTSFVLLRKSQGADDVRLYVVQASHIGFKKRGNRRATDPAGNDLVTIQDDYLHGRECKGRWLSGWRDAPRLMPALLLSNSSGQRLGGAMPLSRLAQIRRERGKGTRSATGTWYTSRCLTWTPRAP